jgi:hypothetical protein
VGARWRVADPPFLPISSLKKKFDPRKSGASDRRGCWVVARACVGACRRASVLSMVQAVVGGGVRAGLTEGDFFMRGCWLRRLIHDSGDGDLG